MEIEHTLYGTQVKYGYIWWRSINNDRYRQIFPDGDFTIDLEGRRISGRQVDWSSHRVSIGQNVMQELFTEDEKVKISKQADNLVVVQKLGGRIFSPQPPPGHPLSVKLRETQRDSDNPSHFENAVAEAFSFLGFNTRHIGGKDEADVILEDIKAVIDTKTTKESVISERYINFDAMERYRNNHLASFTAVVAPGFSEGNIRDTSAKRGITLIETEALCKLIENHAQYPYELNTITAVLFKSDKTVISSTDIPSSLIDEEKLIELAASILNVLKVSGRKAFTVTELMTYYEFKGLDYNADEIAKALLFLSSPPLLILQSERDQYKITVNFQTLIKKMGLIVDIYSRFSRMT